MQRGLVASAIIQSCWSKVRSASSKVTSFSPSFALRMLTVLPSIASASKACKGCPKVCSTKLVISTALFLGVRPIAIKCSFNQSGLSVIVTFEIKVPLYAGQPFSSSIFRAIGFVAVSGVDPCGTSNFGASYPFVIIAARKSRATPMCPIASVRLGVKPISNTKSLSTLKTELHGVPGIKAASRTKIPSCSLPSPNSSSAQIIPKLTSPRILPFLIFNSSSPGYNRVPTVATGTFCPAATLGAPQTICTASSAPMSTVVIRSLSALGCWTQVSTSPTTTPLSPPGMVSTSSKPSTSRPVSVNNSETSSGLRSIGK